MAIGIVKKSDSHLGARTRERNLRQLGVRCLIRMADLRYWWAVLGLNQRPMDYESTALTN